MWEIPNEKDQDVVAIIQTTASLHFYSGYCWELGWNAIGRLDAACLQIGSVFKQWRPESAKMVLTFGHKGKISRKELWENSIGVLRCSTFSSIIAPIFWKIASLTYAPSTITQKALNRCNAAVKLAFLATLFIRSCLWCWPCSWFEEACSRRITVFQKWGDGYHRNPQRPTKENGIIFQSLQKPDPSFPRQKMCFKPNSLNLWRQIRSEAECYTEK